jgi:glycine/D-amino acid oxidase-like deaminating enzyme
MPAPSGRAEAYWAATAPATDFPPLAGDIDVDVAIVGGGIVGITAARLLKEAGLRAAVIEGRKVGRQVTGKSTAKITSQHELIYHRLTGKFGEDGARTYAEANQAAIGPRPARPRSSASPAVARDRAAA